MSTRCPAHVKRTPLTGGEGTRLCFTRPGDPPSAPRPGPASSGRGWSLCAVFFVWPPRGSSPAQADAVVVLSGARDSRLDPALGARPPGRRAGARDLERRPRTRSGARHAQLCTRRRKRTRSRVICFEARPYSTQGEARASRGSRGEHRWTHVVVVTSTFHVTRARMLVRRCYHGPALDGRHASTWWRLPEEWASRRGKLPCS